MSWPFCSTAITLAGQFPPSERHLIDLGSAERFAPGSVTSFPELGFHLVRLETGEFLALYIVDPHLGCKVPWRPDFVFAGKKGWFRNPCHGETYDMEGKCWFGPCPRGLDRFPTKIEGGKVLVDLSTLIQGPTRPGAQGTPTPVPSHLLPSPYQVEP